MLNAQHHQQTTRHQQTGATLVVVLLLLVVLATISVITVKHSSSSLKVAAAAQVDNVLFQANDKAFLRFENSHQNAKGSYHLPSISHYMIHDMQLGESLIFCVDSVQLNFDVNHATHQTRFGGTYLGKDNGYCNLNNSNDYNSLGKVITQLSFVVNQPLTKINKNKFPQNIPTACIANITGVAISLVPAMSNITQNQVSQCFMQASVAMPLDTTSNCLKNAGAVISTHRQDYQLLVKTSRPNCLGEVSDITLNPTLWMVY